MSAWLYTSPHENLNSLQTRTKETFKEATDWEIIELTIDAIRVLIFFFLVGFYTTFSLERSRRNGRETQGLDESSPLLLNGRANGNGHVRANGAIDTRSSEARSSSQISHNGITASDGINGSLTGRKSPEELPAFYKSTTVPNKTWYEYLRGYSLFFPYLWPQNSLRLQLIVVVCFVIVLVQRAVNMMVPIQMATVTNQLTGKDGYKGMPWLSISLLIAFKFMQGSSGILSAARSVLWIPISQYSYQALTTASFEHVHDLSLDFHLGKRTGEVISALNKGNSINNFLEQVTFSVLPMVFDLGVAIIYFGVVFDAYYALVVSVITFAYLYLTIRMARWRAVREER
jgi:hypothetical protein